MSKSCKKLTDKYTNLFQTFCEIKSLGYPTNLYSNEYNVLAFYMMWKFCGKAQFTYSIGAGNCAFPRKFSTIKLGEITVFYAVVANVFSPSFWKNPWNTPLSKYLKISRQKILNLYTIYLSLLISVSIAGSWVAQVKLWSGCHGSIKF